MTSHPHIAAIDFDSQNVYLAVGTRDTTSLAQPLQRADAYPNESIRRGTVIEHNGLIATIGQILRTLDTAYPHKVPLFLGVHPSSLKSRIINVSLSLFQNNQPRPITDSDCDQITKKAQATILNENPNLYILTTIPRRYHIDSTQLQPGANPIGFQAAKLSCEFLIITCLSHDVNDFVDAFENFQTHIYDVIATPIATALLVTEPKRRMFGCGVLYVSSEVTSFVIFEDGIPLSCTTFPIGIEDVVSDTAVGLQISIDKARALLADPSKINDEQAPARKRFGEVIQARYLDIIERIQKTLTTADHPVVLPGGITLVTTSIQLHTLRDSLFSSLKIPVTLWEGDIPSTTTKKRTRDISIIGAYSIICAAGNPNKPLNNTKNAVTRVLRDTSNSIKAAIHRFLS
jgi:cell division ATPase FtsA